MTLGKSKMFKRIRAAAAALALTGAMLTAPHQGYAANSTQARSGWATFHAGGRTQFGDDYGAKPAPAPKTNHYAFLARQSRFGVRSHDKEIRCWDAYTERWLTKLVAWPYLVCD